MTSIASVPKIDTRLDTGLPQSRAGGRGVGAILLVIGALGQRQRPKNPPPQKKSQTSLINGETKRGIAQV